MPEHREIWQLVLRKPLLLPIVHVRHKAQERDHHVKHPQHGPNTVDAKNTKNVWQ